MECAAGRYDAAETFLIPDQQAAVIAQIRAVERLHGAAEGLSRRTADRFGLAATESVKYTRSANVLGPLSPHARLLNYRLESDHATVIYQVGDRLPLESIEMTRRDGRWLLVTDAIEDMPGEIEKLAGVLEHGIVALDDPGTGLDDFRRDLELHAAPILRRLRLLTESAGGRSTNPAD